MNKKVKRSIDHHVLRNNKKQIKISDLKSLKRVRDTVAGIDIGGEFHYVAAPDPKHGGKVVVNRYGGFTSNLIECVKWLKECKIESVAMEATSVYWTILYTMLEDQGIKVILVNPHNIKKMKEKKTDVCDAEYLQLFHSYDLLEGSVILDKQTNELRTITRLRQQSIEESAKAIQRMHKALINMNIRLDNVLSDISGVTGMKIIRAILAGERDPKTLALYRDERCHKSIEEIEDALHGFYQEDHLFALKRAVREHEFHIEEIRKCDEMIQTQLKKFASVADYKQEKNLQSIKSDKKMRRRKTKPFEFSFDVREEIGRITGVNLTDLPGIGPSTALTLISETGLDMSKWKSEKHFASWLGLAANNKVSGGKILSNKSKPKKKAAIYLRMAVSGLYRDVNDTALGAFIRRKRAHIGAPKAITAGAAKLARMYYMTLKTGKPFIEMGAAKYLEMQKVKYLRKIRKTIKPWGYDITLKEDIESKKTG